MYIKPFAVEEWMNEWEVGARYNIAETCVDSVSLNELFALTGEDKAAFLENLAARRLTYGDIEGAPAFRQGICSLYKTVKPENIVTTHGAAGANHHVFCSLVSPGDRVISVLPTYQQLYSIPESLGAKVKILPLSRENGYLPDLDALRALAVPGTKMICINNPNNPTGALMSRDMLEEIVQIAREAGAYILCDEVYRHLSQTDEWSESIADLYEKGISVSSMSKVFSLAGLRLGWIATRDKDALRALVSHRDYDLISGGMIDEAIAALALKHSDKMLARSRAIVRENLAILDNWVTGEKHASYVKPLGGTTALVYYDFDIPSYELCEEMYHKTGAFVTPGDCFEQPKSMRIGYAYGKEALVKGLKAVSEYFAWKEKEKVFTVTAALRAVESAYAGKSAGTGRVWPMVFHEFDPGHADLDIKSGDLESAGVYGLKVVSWYDSNAEKALPALFGTSLLFDLATGEPKALLNAGPITALRTGAAAAIGAKYLARKDAKTLTIVGCGELCPYLAAAALAAIPSLKTVYLAAVTAATDALLKACGHARTAAINAAADAASAVGESDIVFTATRAKTPVVKSAWVKPGTHVSCIGADLPGKQEVESAVLARAAVYGDDTAQCFAVGECELPHKEGVLPAPAGELGEVILGEKAGRTSGAEITVFDSTGIALQDIASAAVILNACEKQGLGTVCEI